MGNRFSKPVAFNHTNESDQIILNHLIGRNFSGYVKELIMADIRKGNEPKREHGPFPAVSDGVRKIVKKNTGGIQYIMTE